MIEERYQFIKVRQFNKLAADYQADGGSLAANSAAERLISTAGDSGDSKRVTKVSVVELLVCSFWRWREKLSR